MEWQEKMRTWAHAYGGLLHGGAPPIEALVETGIARQKDVALEGRTKILKFGNHFLFSLSRVG